MVVVGWFEIVVGVAIAGLWGMLLVTRQVPELEEGRRDILFHMGAELVTAVLLIGGGVAVLTVGGPVATVLAAFAAGSLLYTTINSPGHYADLGQWSVVGVFMVLVAATATIGIVLVRSAS